MKKKTKTEKLTIFAITSSKLILTVATPSISRQSFDSSILTYGLQIYVILTTLTNIEVNMTISNTLKEKLNE